LTDRTVTITVTARKPVAWVVDASMKKEDFSPGLEAVLTDENGRLMTMRVMRPEFLPLPVIFGVQTEKLEDAKSLESEDFRVARMFIDTVKRRGGGLFTLRSIDISRGWALEAANDQDSKFLFAQKTLLTPADMDVQLNRMQQVINYATDNKQIIGTANLAVARNLPITFQVAQAAQVDHVSESLAEPSSSKPATSAPQRKPAPASTPAKKPVQQQKR